MFLAPLGLTSPQPYIPSSPLLPALFLARVGTRSQRFEKSKYFNFSKNTSIQYLEGKIWPYPNVDFNHSRCKRGSYYLFKKEKNEKIFFLQLDGVFFFLSIKSECFFPKKQIRTDCCRRRCCPCEPWLFLRKHLQRFLLRKHLSSLLLLFFLVC